jgi:hypothetical protein
MMNSARRSPKTRVAAKVPAQKPGADAQPQTVKLPPMDEQRAEGRGNLKGRAAYFLKRRGQSKA